jgi:uncharacterized membrane protein YdfJ with MMPL/SSD domain
MSMTDIVIAVPWATIAGAVALLGGMALIAAGLRYDRVALERVRKEERP